MADRENALREIHGLTHIRKVAAMSGDHQDVQIVDGPDSVMLRLTANSFPAQLTPDEARFIGTELLRAADRVEGKS